MGKSRIYSRNCFVCDEPMTLREDGWPLLECVTCDITENGNIKGRFSIEPLPVEWLGEFVKFIDHSKVYLPSPDCFTDHPVVACETVS